MPSSSSILRDENALRAAISCASSVKQALELLGLRAAGGNYAAFRAACARLDIQQPYPDAARRGLELGVGRPFPALPDEVLFQENSTYCNRKGIKLRLIASGVPEQCALCGIGPEWNDKPLTLQLDHINGVHNDHRRENLRLLCANCHSQTSTFAGRSRQGGRVRAIEPPTCPHCSTSVRRRAKKCPTCNNWLGTPAIPPRRPEKITWPADVVLVAMVRKSSLLATGRALGVSDNAVRKRLRSRGLMFVEPPTGLEPVA